MMQKNLRDLLMFFLFENYIMHLYNDEGRERKCIQFCR